MHPAPLLDANKAFDRVHYCKLLTKLKDRQMCPLILRLLIKSYTKQMLQVKWGNDIPHAFGISNGVKQGGMLSPVLFAVYIDTLLLKL